VLSRYLQLTCCYEHIKAVVFKSKNKNYIYLEKYNLLKVKTWNSHNISGAYINIFINVIMSQYFYLHYFYNWYLSQYYQSSTSEKFKITKHLKFLEICIIKEMYSSLFDMNNIV